MKLKAIEIQGFKSFPDKTRLNFDNGITVIVGPNGSGKSNITDAVRWVLGEMSTKSIRGSKMEDVIFGGSDNRRPMSYAEVTLFIDNTQGLGRLEDEHDEVSVTRRYFRGGDSEYLINGRKGRLRDIAELFMNTGVGKTGYSNIGQGKIAEIISQKSDERRSVFEEAAGISKFRVRKNEAERKLRDTEANLLRVGDMLSELGDRVGPLEKEAAAARKYLDLHEQKKEVDVSLWLYQANTMRSVADETERLYAAAKLELESVDGEISSFQQRSEALYSEAGESRVSAEKIIGQMEKINEERYRLESSGQVLENDISHTESRITQARQELEARKNALLDGQTRESEFSALLETKAKQRTETAEKIKDKTILLEKQTLECEELERKILDCDDERRLIESEITNLRVLLSAMDGSHEAGRGRKQDLAKQIDALTESVAALEDNRKRTAEKEQSYADSIRLMREELTRAHEKTKANEERQAEIRTKLNGLAVGIETRRKRAEALRRMDELLEGYSYSVKNVMHAAEIGEISGICGPVSRLLKVKKEYSIAIETSLGANIQNIITENEDAAKNAISFLKRTGGGRATFYPITSVKARQPAVTAGLLASHRGYIGMADALCTFDTKYSGVIGYLLGGTAVFDNLDNASYSAKAFGYRLRIVTLDGQLVNAGGSFTGGSVKTDSGILTRSAEISAINEEITSLELRQKAETTALEKLEAESAESGEKIEDLEGRISLMQTLCQNEHTALEVIKTRIESEKERLEALQTDFEGIDEENSRYDAERSDLCWNIKQAENKLEQAEKLLDTARTENSDADDARQDTEKERNALLVSVATLDTEIESLKSSSRLNQSTVSALEAEIERSEALILTLQEKLVTARSRIKQQTAEKGEISGVLETLAHEKEKLAKQNEEFEKKQSEIRGKLSELGEKRDFIYKEYVRLESKQQQINADHDRLSAKIWEDYELTYSAAVELNYPPITEKDIPDYNRRQAELRNKLRALGHVNVGAIEEYADVKERYEFSKTQYDDLIKARESLDGIIGRLDREMKTKFITAFEAINRNFAVTFRELFGGGTANISLSDPDDVLSSGIEINVAPPGKIINNLISLSGGEQSFVAIALMFAILNVNPTPFCIFDEIESALDEVNVVRLSEYMKRYSEKTQFIVIT
ncbi:MAG: chromosome segregation protein SMC, partial [Clostridia bacterium]|nr:chromosome segregation protein SMC [Clostridia bacterium]